VALIIRTAHPDELAKLRDIYRRSSLSNERDRQVLLDNPEYLVLPAAPVVEGRTRVAERTDGDIVGFATVERSATAAELIDLFVDPGSMRQGVARALIDDAVAELVGYAIVDLQVTANNHALAFYLAVGFEILDTTTTPLGSGVRMRLKCDATGHET